MNRKNKGLGKSLDALLAGAGISSSHELTTMTDNKKITDLLLEQITPGKYQPRRSFKKEELEELVQSIQSQGILQPIIVRLVQQNQYEIIAGERRWQAAKRAGLSHIPAMIRQVNDSDAMLIALIENIQRSNLNTLEEAMALQRLAEEFQLTHAEISQTVGKSRSTVSNLLRVLDLNEEVKKLLEEGKIELGHAKLLLSIKGLLQTELARNISENQLSVRATEKLLLEQHSKNSKRKENKIDPNILQLQNDLSDKLAAKVEITFNGKKKGKVMIHYHSLEELDGILKRF